MKRSLKWNNAARASGGISTALFIVAALMCSKAIALEEIGKVKLPPLESQTARTAGMEEHYLKDGEPYVIKIHNVEDGVYHAEDSSGCLWSALVDSFGPALSWEKCNGSKGKRTIYKTKGKPFPMKKKSKFSFSFNGRNHHGDTWRGSRTCKYQGGVKIRLRNGEHDTHKLVCVEGKNTRTYYLTPDVGELIAFKRKHKSDKSRSYVLELVEVVNPA